MNAGITAERAIDLVRALSAAASRMSMATGSVEATLRLLDVAAPLALELVIVCQVDQSRNALRSIASCGVNTRAMPALPLDRSMPITDAVISDAIIELPASRDVKIARYPAAASVTTLPLDREWICFPISWAGKVRAAVMVAAGPDGFTGQSRFVLDILTTEIGRALERAAGVGGVGHWAWNTHTGAMSWCDHTRNIHGFSSDSAEPSFDGYLELIHPDDRAMVLERLRDALTNAARGARFDAEMRIVQPDGETRRLRARAEVIRGKDGDPTFFGTHEDITEQCHLDEKIRATQQMEALGLLAGGIAHDFNNLLVGILGNASLAHTELEYDSPIAPMLRDIEHSAQRAADLTRQLLAYAGKGRLIVRPANLAGLVHEMRAVLATAISRRATLLIHADFDDAWVQADATQLRQIIINLITNASDALLDEHGEITLRADVRELDAASLMPSHGQALLPPGTYAVLEVSDTGMGMTPEVRARVFDPFFTTKDSGHGLGLSATLGIIRGHGGMIQVESSPGRGCTIRVILPTVKRQHRPEPTIRSAPSVGRGGSVLLVDDDDAVRNVARRSLERAGFVVHEAVNGLEGVERFDELDGLVSLVLLDLTMPVMGGEEAMQLMRDRNPEVRVLLSSGYNEQESSHRFAGTNVVRFIQKPYTVQELLTAVETLLDDD